MIAVFTPTFNRAYSLPRLFESLQRQTYRDFEWIIADDGSSDATQNLCQSFIEKAAFPMRCFWQENSGKHAAINFGANVARGWFFIVDSDDWLPDRGLETSARYLAQIQGDGRFAGVAGLPDADESHMLWIRGTSEDDLTEEGRRQLSKEYVDATSDDYRYRYGIPGDRARIARTDLVQKHPFPVFAGERFMSEGVLWQRLSDEGYLFHEVSQITNCGDCLSDGLSQNASAVYRKSPRGTACTKNDMPSSKKPLRTKPRDAVSYIRYGRAAGMRVDRLFSICRKRLLFLLALPVALAFPVKKDMGA